MSSVAQTLTPRTAALIAELYDTDTQSAQHVARQAWRDAVSTVADKAKATLPDCTGRVDSAVKMVLAGDVELQADGTAKIASQSNGRTEYLIVNGHCDCKDFDKAPSNWCKHRIAAGLVKRANTLLDASLTAQAKPTPAVEPAD